MKIAIDARSATLSNGTGIGTYTNNLLSELLESSSSDEYTLFCCGKFNNRFNTVNSKIIYSSGKHGNFYEKYYIPKKLKDFNIDLYHIPQNGLGLNYPSDIPTIVTIHDLIPYIMPETVGRGYLERFLRDMPEIIKNSSAILTVSNYSKKDILKFFNFYPEDKVFVVPLAANDTFKPLDKIKCKDYVRSNFKITEDYILYLGGFSSRKNVLGLIKAFSSVYKDLNKRYKLLISGILKDDGEKLSRFVIDNNLEDKIVFSGYLSDDILPILYSGCEAFVYPSLYEGFGLPPLEAMSCGAPVITSNLSSIPEVTSDCAVLVNPYNETELMSSLVRLLNDEALKLKLSQDGYNRSLNFNWHKTAMNTFNVYKEVYESI